MQSPSDGVSVPECGQVGAHLPHRGAEPRAWNAPGQPPVQLPWNAWECPPHIPPDSLPVSAWPSGAEDKGVQHTWLQAFLSSSLTSAWSPFWSNFFFVLFAKVLIPWLHSDWQLTYSCCPNRHPLRILTLLPPKPFRYPFPCLISPLPQTGPDGLSNSSAPQSVYKVTMTYFFRIKSQFALKLSHKYLRLSLCSPGTLQQGFGGK